MRDFLSRYMDDALLIGGCAAILYGLSLWSAVVTWIVGGVMLIGFAILIGLRKGKQS